MSEVEYCWNWSGTRKHIYHQGEPDRWGHQPNTLCGHTHMDRKSSEKRHHPTKLDGAPLCQHCARKAGIDSDLCPTCNGKGRIPKAEKP